MSLFNEAFDVVPVRNWGRHPESRTKVSEFPATMKKLGFDTILILGAYGVCVVQKGTAMADFDSIGDFV